MKITLENSPKNKQIIVSEVLKDLPEWFGMDDSITEYIENSAIYPLWVAKKYNEVLGFINLKETAENVGEIYCMGIKKKWHGKKIGTYLFAEFEEYAKLHYKFIQVKTVKQGRYKEYDQTINFYKSVGFIEFEVFPTLWDEWNPCLIMIKSII
ncbi:MAG: GNAT family N-acetyltransferase [Vagococcus sp.]|jgi:N-acetylglutamate synthase-like GNAT family acetyltransferase|nr:GNAT family N-acetyltransferase [Vagococcus sp.]